MMGACVKVFRTFHPFGKWHHGIISRIDKQGHPTEVLHYCRATPDERHSTFQATSVNFFLSQGSQAQVLDEASAFSSAEVVHRACTLMGRRGLPKTRPEDLALLCYRGTAN
jgi:hypothetical protein